MFVLIRFWHPGMVTGILGLQYAAWITIPSRPSALRASVLMCWVVSIWPTTYWVDNTVRCAYLLVRSRTPLSSVSPPVSPSRLNSVEHLVGWTTTPCFGKDFFPPSGGSLSEPDCTGLWASDSQSHLPFSSQPAKYSPTLAACVLPPTMPRLAVRGLRVASFGERWSVPSATRPPPLSVARSSIMWTTPGFLRFAWGW